MSAFLWILVGWLLLCGPVALVVGRVLDSEDDPYTDDDFERSWNGYN